MDFETHRPRLRAVAYRMLGSLTEADDAVQETWLRVARTDLSEVGNEAGWLTTVTARICLDALRRRAARPEEPFGMPDPVVTGPDGLDPEHEVLLADAVGLALLVVLDTLTPAERLAFVLHDTLGVPFDDIGRLVGRSSNATAQLASRARRRIRDAAVTPDADLARQWKVAEAFLAAARLGDFAALVEVLAPDVVLRADIGEPNEFRGVASVGPQVLSYARMAPFARRVLVNGAVGFVPAPGGRAFAVIALTVRHDRVTAITIVAEADRVARLQLP